MQTEERSGTEERAILTGLLTSRPVCARLAPIWTTEGLFRSKYANLLGGWGVAHFNKYGDAIGHNIETKLAAYAATTADKDTLALVESLIVSLSNDWQGSNQNADYVIDMAQKYTAGITVERAIAAAQIRMQRGEVEEAVSVLTKLTPPVVSAQQWIDPLRDHEAMRRAWEVSMDPLITFPGALGELFKNAFRRDTLIVFRAIAKAGKSFNLLEIAYLALLQGRKVAYFCIGDMSESQVMQRLGQRVAKRPLYKGIYKVPIGWDKESADPFPVMRDMSWDADMSWEDMAEAGTKFLNKIGAGDTESRCRLAVYGAGGLNTLSLDATLSQWASEGFNADCTIIDYADLLGAIPGTESKVASLEETWRQLSAIRLKYHSCLVTASQSDRKGYNQELLDMDNFNGTRTQNDNASHIYSINQTAAEADIGLQRIQKIANRDNPDSRVVVTAGSRSVACPIMHSAFCKPKDEEKPKPKRK